MNLVQISEHLKDVPMQALAAYANGKDPMVPAYMATGEMQRREAMKQRSAASQQAGQGQKPTIKEQIEQKAGLMSLQSQQQQQAQQQMMQQAQAQPMPTPPETPQPQMQEEEQPEFAMGGIAQLPVNYDFASGGIIAFSEGDKVPVVEESEEEKKLRIARELLSKGNMPMPQNAQGLKSLETQPPKDTRPGANIPGMYDTTAADIVKKRLTPRTMQEVFASQAEADKLAGVTGKYGEEQMKRYAEEDAQYKEMLKERDNNRLLAVLSGIGRGGLGGAAPAYLKSRAAEQAADIAQKRRMTQMYGDVEAKQREEAIAKSKGITTPYETGYTQAGDIASRQATQQMTSQTEFEKEAINNKNALDRLDIQYKRDLEAARLKNLNDQDLRKIENDYALKRDEINNKAAADLAKYRSTAPTDEQRNIDSYLALWKKDPANKNKPLIEGSAQYWMDRGGGSGRGDKPYITGLNQLLESYQKQLEDITLPEAEKAKIRAAVIKTQKDLEAAVGRGLPSLPTGSTQLPPGFVPDQPGR